MAFARILFPDTGPLRKEEADGTRDHDLGLWSILKASGLGMENIP